MRLQTKEQSFRRSALYEESVAKYQGAIAFDGTNAGAHAALAQTYFEAGELDAAIHEWRLAIGSSPHGPQSRGWKTRLKGALEMQGRLAQGLPADGFADFKVCHKCQFDVPSASKTCSRCGATLEMGFVEWSLKPENRRNIWREAWPMILVVSVVVMVSWGFSLEVKACLIMATVMVGGFYFLRGIGE